LRLFGASVICGPEDWLTMPEDSRAARAKQERAELATPNTPRDAS